MHDALVSFARFVAVLIVAGLAIAVFYRLITGQIRTRGLLSNDDGTPSPNSVQLLVMTIIGALWYLARAVDAGTLPDVPEELLLLIGGSGLTFVGTEAFGWFFGNERERLRMRSGKKEP